MRWLRQSSIDYLKDRAIELIRDREILRAIKCLIALMEKLPDGTPKDQK